MRSRLLRSRQGGSQCAPVPCLPSCRVATPNLPEQRSPAIDDNDQPVLNQSEQELQRWEHRAALAPAARGPGADGGGFITPRALSAATWRAAITLAWLTAMGLSACPPRLSAPEHPPPGGGVELDKLDIGG